MTIVPLSVSIWALYFFLGSICISGGCDHCFAIWFSPFIISRRAEGLRFQSRSRSACALITLNYQETVLRLRSSTSRRRSAQDELLFQKRIYSRYDHVERRGVKPSLRDNDICITFGWLDEF